MIKGFADKETERLWLREQRSKVIPGTLQRRALLKLSMLDAADSLADLRIPPGNKLKQLSGTRKGQHSIWINEQFRICFVWQQGDVYDVEITDYH